MERRTPLYECHERAGGKIVPFAGYLLPVQYKTGVIAEHMAVRTACGLFDVSHMGEVVVKGVDALDNLQRLFTNDMSGMQNGRVRYSPMCNESGGVVDDLIAYKLSDACYLVVVNAANREKDVAWMRAHLGRGSSACPAGAEGARHPCPFDGGGKHPDEVLQLCAQKERGGHSLSDFKDRLHGRGWL